MTPVPERKALVVDDHPTNRLLACAMLRKLGWAAEEAASGEAALRLAKEQRFNLVLLDISMPGISGEETCIQLRQLPQGDKLSIIAYTAHAFPEEKARFLAVGFNEILVKPINRERLEALVGTL